MGRGLGRGLFWLSLGLVVTLVAAGAVIAVADRPSAEELLDRARRFAGRADTVSFTGTARVEAAEMGGIPGTGEASFVLRPEARGVARFPDSFRMRQHLAQQVSDVMVVRGQVFSREADTRAELVEAKWVRSESADRAERRAGVVRPGRRNFLPFEEFGPFVSPVAPSDLRAVLARAAGAEVDELTRERYVLRGTVDLSRVHDRDIGDVRLARMVLTARRRSGTIERLGLSFKGDFGRVNLEYHFSKWDEEATIEAPGRADIDATPGIEEEELAEFDAVPLLQPRGLPEGWVLEGAFVLPAEETAEDCEQVGLDYIDPDDEESGYLSLFEMPVDCADATAPPGSVVFRAGPSTGWLMEDEGFVEAQIVSGRTAIQVDTDLAPADLAVVLGQLVPFDLNVKPVALRGIGARRSGA